MRNFTSLLLCGVNVICFSAGAHAQDVSSTASGPATPAAIAEQGDTLEAGSDIIVTARRREESVKDVPQTVNVVTAAQVEKLNLRNFTDIQNVVPGLQLSSASSFATGATVRGIAYAPQASGNNPSVEFYLNDAPIAAAFLFQTTFDFGQFELQRGPQGTLRGRASPSGSIAVTTRRPDLTEAGVTFDGTITNRHAYKGAGAFNIPLIRDVLGLRLAAAIDEDRYDRVKSIRQGVDSFTSLPYRRTKAYRATIRFEPAPWASFNVMYQGLNTEDHRFEQVISRSLVDPTAPVVGPIITVKSRQAIDEEGSYDRQDQRVLIGNADFRFAGQRLSYVGSYSHQDSGVLGAQDAGNFFAPPRVPTISLRTAADPVGFDPVCQTESRRNKATFTTGAYFQCTHTIARRTSHEVRLASETRIAGIFDYVVGGFYDHNSTPSNLTQETPVVLSAAAVPVTVLAVSRTSILRRGKTTEKSAFGNLTAHFLDDKLEVSGGLRYISYKDNSSLLQGAATGAVTCPGFATRCNLLAANRSNDNATIYLGSIKYKITPDILLYALTGSSFRAGPRVVGDFSINQTPREQSFLNLPPERSKSYEIGAKTSFDHNRGKFYISAYHQTFKNYPFRPNAGVFFLSTQPVNNVPITSVTNFNFVSAVPVTVNGVEGEASYQLSNHFNVGLNASYADGKIKNGVIACNDLNGDGKPDANPATPTVAQLQAAVGPGQTVAQCGGVNQNSTQTPKFSANVQAEYDVGVTQFADGFVRGLYSFYGKTSGDENNPFDSVGAYGLLNLYLGVRDKDGAWELSLFGKNLTQERRALTFTSATPTLTTVRSVAASTSYSSQYYAITSTIPREFGVNLRVALGSH